jgi:hypothetical protein
VKNKVLLISLAVVFVIGMSLIGCGGEELPPTAPESIKVGLARDLDGPLSVFECGYGGATYRWFANKVNDEGGVHLSDYDTAGYTAMVPIELVVRDFDVMTWDIAAVTEALIDTDKCDFIWGGPGTDCIFTQAPVCNALATVYIGLEGGASSMIWEHQIDGWPYVWPTLSFSNWYQVPVLYDMLEEALGRAPVAYMTYIGELGATHGIEYRDEAIAVFGADNIIDAGFHSYQLTEGEAAAMITAAQTAYNAAPYDVFWCETYPWNVFTVAGALLASNFNPPCIVFGPGGNANVFPVLFGAPNVEGMLDFIVADDHTSTAISNLYDELSDQVEIDWDDPTLLCDQGPMTSGFDSLDFWGMPCYAAGLEMWQTAVENAGNLDSIAVRNELVKFSPTNPCETVLGDTWFTVFGNGNGGGILAYECHPGEIGQWQSGEYRTVGGNDPTASFIFPMTDKWGWLQ